MLELREILLVLLLALGGKLITPTYLRTVSLRYSLVVQMIRIWFGGAKAILISNENIQSAVSRDQK